MRGFRFAKLILAYAAFSETEDGRECLFWEWPVTDGIEETRVVFADGRGIYTETRIRSGGSCGEWNSDGGREGGLADTVNEIFFLLDCLGMDASEVVGTGFEGIEEDLDERIPKRRVRRG